MTPQDKADIQGDIIRANQSDEDLAAACAPPSPTVPRNQVLKLVEQALRSQLDPGTYTQRAFRDLVSDRTGAVTRGIEPMHEWKKRALSMVLACLDTPDLPLQRDERMNPLPPLFFVVAHDPETYQTLETTNVVEAWKELMFCPKDSANQDEVDAFEEYAGEPDNWHRDHDGQPAILIWDVNGEGGGTIEFYRINHTPPDIQSLTTCRDHWKTSFEHERENVIRLRSLLARAHQSMSEGGRQCDCRDCHIFRFGGNQPPQTSQAIAQGDRTCSACGRLVAPPEMMTRFSDTVNLCSACL